MRFVLLLVLLLSGCTSAAYQYAQAKHPGCKVTQLEETRDNVRVLVECPGSDPFEQTFRKR
jgi:hypothetical protein